MRLFVTILLSFIASIRSEEEQLGVREMLAFVELNLMNLLEYGNYPAMYNSSFPKMEECGCYYSPKKIVWGNKIGLECQRGLGGVAAPEFNAEKCGIRCNDMHGFDTVLFCPAGWDASCIDGCTPTAKFDSIEHRVEFWDKTISAFLHRGTDYIQISSSHLEECGCITKARKILYGTGVGFNCIMGEDSEAKPGCSASSNCVDPRGKKIVTFCPAGHRTTCDGCEKAIEKGELIERLEWMVRVTKGIVQNSLSQINWQPSMEQLLGCACKGGIKRIDYGSQVGVLCEVHSYDLIGEACGPNPLCIDDEGKEIIHICPKGFRPSCNDGCAIPIVEKGEL